MKKQTQKLKMLLGGVAVFALVFVATTAVKASIGNISGGLWGGSEDANISGSQGVIDGNEAGAGWISMSGATYGVTIPATDGPLFGYAWSENLGWISFNAGDLAGCPSAPCTAQRVNNNIQGWARVVAIEQAGANAGGWQGFIHLNGSNYGVTIDTTTGALGGGGWSGEEAGTGGNVANGLGYIDFSKAKINVIETFKVCRNSCANGSLVNSATNESMLVGDSRTYKACYDISTDCTGGTDVTNSTTWSDTNSPNAVNVSGGVVTAIAEGTEGVNAAYDPGTGSVNSTFNVNVSAPPVTCGSATVGGPYDSAPTANLCSDSALHRTVTSSGSTWAWTCGSSACSAARNATSSTTWREVAP